MKKRYDKDDEYAKVIEGCVRRAIANGWDFIGRDKRYYCHECGEDDATISTGFKYCPRHGVKYKSKVMENYWMISRYPSDRGDNEEPYIYINWGNIPNGKFSNYTYIAVTTLIFDHDFAKHLWPEDYEIHLANLALSKNRQKYLKENS